MTYHYSDLGSGSDWSCREGNLFQPIRSTSQMLEVTRYQYGISALVSQTSFRGETNSAFFSGYLCGSKRDAALCFTCSLTSSVRVSLSSIGFTLSITRAPCNNMIRSISYVKREQTSKYFVIITNSKYCSISGLTYNTILQTLHR